LASASRILALRAAAALALAAAPVAWFQGRRLRRYTPRLDEAPGKRSGALPGNDPVFRIVGLGESPMAGVGLNDQSESLIPLLARQLATASARGVDWETAARSGATARFTEEDLLPRLASRPVDLAVVALGVNDCLALTPPARWRARLEHLTQAIAARLEPECILLTGVPPMQYFPALHPPLSTLMGRRAALLDAVSARFAQARVAIIHAPMSFVDQPEGLFCRDGFHPNARAHALWAKQLASLVAVE